MAAPNASKYVSNICPCCKMHFYDYIFGAQRHSYPFELYIYRKPAAIPTSTTPFFPCTLIQSRRLDFKNSILQPWKHSFEIQPLLRIPITPSYTQARRLVYIHFWNCKLENVECKSNTGCVCLERGVLLVFEYEGRRLVESAAISGHLS